MTDYATLYLQCESLLDFDLKELESVEEFGTLKVTVVADGSTATIESPEWTVTLNAAPSDETSGHVAGLAGYLASCHQQAAVDDFEGLKVTIDSTTLVVGCVVEPSFDDEGLVGGLLGLLVHGAEGVFFARDTIFDSLGKPVAGLLKS